MDRVLDFIDRRFKWDNNWLNGNCLWFAHILKSRFEEAEVYYLPIEGHFVTKIDNNFYDWSGIVVPEEKAISWLDIVCTDSAWAERLTRDCWQ